MLKKTLLLAASVSLAFISTAQVTDPMITKWWFNTNGNKYAGILTDVEVVYYNTQNVYIKTSGIPNYYQHGVTHNDGKDLQATWSITRTPAQASNPQGVMGGQMGVMLDGSVFFHPGDAQSYNNAGKWNRLAYFFEGVDMDAANGHSTPTNMYHHHFDNLKLHDWDSSKHSPLVAYAWDGYPVYGPFGYDDANSTTSKVTRIKSSYRTKNYTTRTDGPAVGGQYLIGCFIEDWEYAQGTGHLDEHNGRFCKTPEYPNGTYAYFTTVDESLKPLYPYFIGPTFYGNITQGNTGPNGGKATVPSGAISFTDVDDIAKIEANVSLYPIPVTDYLNIDIKDGKTYTIVLYGLQGSIISTQTVTVAGKMNMSGLPYGTYFVEASDMAGNRGFIKRIVKQ